MGHVMFTAGLQPKQFFWCTACGSYTGKRAQKLAKWCTGRTNMGKCMNLLVQGRHPYDGTWLDTKPRRVTKRDAGYLHSTGNALPSSIAALREVESLDVTMSSTEARVAHGPNPSLMCITVDTIPHLPCIDDEFDPLGLGVELV